MRPLDRVNAMVGVAQLVELRIVIPAVVGSNPIAHPSLSPRIVFLLQGPLAQLAEQLTLNQRVAGSNPARPTSKIKGLAFAGRPFFCVVGLSGYFLTARNRWIMDRGDRAN